MIDLRVERVSHLFHGADADHALKIHAEELDAEGLVEFIHLFEEPAVWVIDLRDLFVAAGVALYVDEVHPAVELAREGDGRHLNGAADELFIDEGIIAELVGGVYLDLNTSVSLFFDRLRDLVHRRCRVVVRWILSGKLKDDRRGLRALRAAKQQHQRGRRER